MRPLPALTASGLTALLCLGLPARAEPAAGWVDPPAKAVSAKPGSAAPAGQSAEVKSSEAKSAEPKSMEPKPAEARLADPAGSDAAETRHATAGHRHRREERAERRQTRQDHRRMAVSSEIDATAPDPRFGGWAGQARRLAGAYLDSVSAPNDVMLAQAPRFYGDRVRFHGRSMSLAALVAEKRRFVRRWPERRYAPQDGTMRTACDAASATCVVHTVLGFRAENPARGARSLGVSELDLTVSFADGRPVIVAESSRVLGRGSAVLSGAERGRRDGA